MTDENSTTGSTTDWIAGLRAGNPAAADSLTRHYFKRLTLIARQSLPGAARRVADEEEIAVSVLHRVCVGVQQGRFPEIHDREDLWALLLTITRGKVADLLKHERRQKRGGGKVRGHSIFSAPGRSEVSGFAELVADELTPEFVVQLDEEQHRLLGLLRDDTHRRIAVWRMEGYSNEEIAVKLDVSVKTVGRKLRMIRETWAREIT